MRRVCYVSRHKIEYGKMVTDYSLFVEYRTAAKKAARHVCKGEKKMKDKKIMRLSYLIFPYLDNTDMFIFKLISLFCFAVLRARRTK